MGKFTQQVSFSVKGFKENTINIIKQTNQDIIQDAQVPTAKGGRMRVDTGFLRNSHFSGLNGSTDSEGVDSYVETLANYKIGDTFSGGWSADYAAARENGARGQPPDHFMRGAFQNAQKFADKNAARVRSRGQ